MKKRPTSVTVIAWILIGLGLGSLFSPVTKGLIMLSNALVWVVSGIGILNGQNWARLLWVVWSAIGLWIGLLMYPMQRVVFLPGLTILAVIATFLFRPEANQYFRASKVPGGTGSI